MSDATKCPKCSSPNVVKNGDPKVEGPKPVPGAFERIQPMFCNTCGHEWNKSLEPKR